VCLLMLFSLIHNLNSTNLEKLWTEDQNIDVTNLIKGGIRRCVVVITDIQRLHTPFKGHSVTSRLLLFFFNIFVFCFWNFVYRIVMMTCSVLWMLYNISKSLSFMHTFVFSDTCYIFAVKKKTSFVLEI